jgi:hypothetical protein
MTRSIRLLGVTLCAAVFALMLAACTPPQATSSQDDNVSANRQYMSALSQMSDDLAAKLQGFSEAASRNDTVSMRTQADNAFQVIELMPPEGAPDDLKELRDGYMEACDELADALTSYLELYDDAAGSSPLSRDAYAARVKEIQDTYDEAISKLSDTDQKATELQK